ncbi:MAG: Rdx family protein [Deltaproteobacteria bacterium]|nr:Rdx family protein [Deltaproteobacteria bacterium]
MRANYPDSNIELTKGGSGIFDIKCNGELIYSRHNIQRRRFPDEGEITKLIEQHLAKK